MLHISSIFRIITKYKIKNIKQCKIIDFFLRCLEKYGRNTSVLYNIIDISNEYSYFIRLLQDPKYFKLFDFHLFKKNSDPYEIESELIRETEILKIKQQDTFDFVQEKINQILLAIDQMKNKQSIMIYYIEN